MEKFVLSNGIPVYIVRLVPRVDFIPYSAMSVVYSHGASVDIPSTLGLTHLGEHMVFRRKKGRQIRSREMVRMGCEVNAETGPDLLTFTGGFTNDIVYESIDSFSEMIVAGDVPKGLEREKNVVLSEMNMDNDEILDGVKDFLFRTLLPGSRVSKTVIGEEAVVSKFTEEDIDDVFNKLFRTKDLMICIATVADVNPIIDTCEKHFGSLTGKAQPYRWRIRRHTAEDDRGMLLQLEEGVPSKIFYGWPTTGFTLPKNHVLCRLLEVILGFDEASLLYRSLRYNQGLIYGLDIAASNYTNYGMFVFMVEVKTGKEQCVINAVDKAIGIVKEGKITEEDLLHAKRQLKMRWISVLCDPLTCVESVSQLAARGWDDFISSNAALLDSITLEEVVEFANLLFDSDKEVTVVATANTKLVDKVLNFKAEVE